MNLFKRIVIAFCVIYCLSLTVLATSKSLNGERSPPTENAETASSEKDTTTSVTEAETASSEKDTTTSVTEAETASSEKDTTTSVTEAETASSKKDTTTSVTEAETATSEKNTTTSVTEAIDRCSPNPCQNGGTCKMNGADYVCICAENIGGKNCENCTFLCGDEKCAFKDFFYCQCKNGKWFDQSIRKCVDIDKCVQSLWEGKCRGKYEICKDGECACEDNYSFTKKGCLENCSCDTTSEECIHSDNGEASCICKEKFYSTGSKCVKEDICATKNPKCDQKCDEGKCSCDQHYTLKDDHKCVLEDSTKMCTDSAKCNPGQCIKEGVIETCICPEKTHYSFKENCTDLCSAKKLPSGICPNDKCAPHETYGFICNCTGKFKQSHDGIHCELKKMCSEEGKSKECERSNAQCVEKPDLDEGFRCICDDGYDKNENGQCTHKCELKKNEELCIKKSAKCILDENYEPICKCPPLFDEDSNKNCVKAKYSYIGNFTVPGKIYENHARRYTRRTERSSIEVDVDYVTLYKDFKNALTDVYKKNFDFFILGCKNQQTDYTCELEMKFKQQPDDKLLNEIADPSRCIPLGNTEFCKMDPNLIMKRASIGVLKLTDPCEESVKNQICGPTTNCIRKGKNNEFDCVCKDGYSTESVYPIFEGEKSFRSHCEDIDECLKQLSCPKNSFCFNTPGNYSCFCNTGFRKNSDDIKIDGCIGVCEHKLCGEHGICQAVGSDGYFCNCTDHYTGSFCNVTNPGLKDLKKSGLNSAAIVGGVLGGVLLIVLIVGFVYFKRYKKISNNDKEFLNPGERP